MMNYVVPIVLALMILLLGFAYHSQSTQISALNSEIGQLDDSVQSAQAQNVVLAAEYDNSGSQSPTFNRSQVCRNRQWK